MENIERRFFDVLILVVFNIFNFCYIFDKDNESFNLYGDDFVEIIY